MISQTAELRSLVEYLRIPLCIGWRDCEKIRDSSSHGWKFIVVGGVVKLTDSESDAMSSVLKHQSVIKKDHPLKVPVESDHWEVIAWYKRTHKKSRRDFVVMFKRKDV